MTTDQQINQNEIMNLMLPLMIMMMMMKMMSTTMKEMNKPKTAEPKPLYEGGPPVGQFKRQLDAREKTVAKQVAEKVDMDKRRRTVNAQGRKLIKQSGENIELIGLDEGWQDRYSVVVYHFRDKDTGEEFIARDVEDIQFKMRVIRGEER